MFKTILYSTIMLVAVTGCGKKIEKTITEKIIERASKGKVKFSEKGSAMRFESEDGSMSFASEKSLEIPEGFPEDVYIIGQSKVSMAAQKKMGYALALNTDQDVVTVGELYKKEMLQKGWAGKKVVKMGEQTVLMFEKEKRAVNVIISKGKKETTVALTVGPVRKSKHRRSKRKRAIH